MSRAMIIRPFGTKAGVDFDRVQVALIDPVLKELGYTGRAISEITASGNIRSDMFQRLLMADLVVADISIHNANVFYELGIRHALRDRMTVLIRARIDEVPFDLKTDRYLTYAPDDLDEARAALKQAIEGTDATRRGDSPVFMLVPDLEPVDPERVQAVPPDFLDEVAQARRDSDLPRLAVLQDEVDGFDWTIAGLRIVGRAQFDRKAMPDARRTWETIQQALPRNPEANLVLATIYQRVGEPTRSSGAIDRLLRDHPTFDGRDRAEALSLKASNLKTEWRAAWGGADDRAASALRSPLLLRARKTYDDGFRTDQNHWYPGVNALALTTVTRMLAEHLPEVWDGFFDDDDDAAGRALAKLGDTEAELGATVARSLKAEETRRARLGTGPDVWFELTRADLTFLTSPDRPTRVRNAYAKALVDGEEASGSFAAEAAARQIRMYRDLGLFAKTVDAALEGLGVADEPAPQPDVPRPRLLVFAGHRVDDVGRAAPRFPRTPEAEQEASRMIAEAIAREQAAAGGPVEGFAGGASGGDILFHEACHLAGVTTTLMLAFSPDAFAAASVNDGGVQWTERYRRLAGRVEVKVMADGPQLPGWLRAKRDYSIWERNNRWILHTALTRPDADTTLIVLWDGAGGDGPGGTADMVKLARGRGVKVVILDAGRLRRPEAEPTGGTP